MRIMGSALQRDRKRLRYNGILVLANLILPETAFDAFTDTRRTYSMTSTSLVRPIS